MRRFEKIPWKERKTQKSENPEISSVWEEIQDLNGDIKRWLEYYLFATAMSTDEVKSLDFMGNFREKWYFLPEVYPFWRNKGKIEKVKRKCRSRQKD